MGDGDASRFTPWQDALYAPGVTLPDIAARECARPVPGNVDHLSFGGHIRLLTDLSQPQYNYILPPNSPTPDCYEAHGIGLGAFTARSFHSGGVHVALGDRAVRRVSDHMDLALRRGLASLSAGDVIPGF